MYMKNLLIVGGTGRNVGKTEFVCRLIRKMAEKRAVYALKVSAVYPDEQLFHGHHGRGAEGVGLYEERDARSGKDTARMLMAGAARVFYLRSDGTDIAEGFAAFFREVPENALLVCESNSLADVVQPAVLVVVRSPHGPVKPRAVAQLERADLVVVSDGQSGFPELARIDLGADGGWWISNG